MIAIMIALDSLHKNFDTTIVSLLEASDKMIDQIQSILQSKKVKIISKQIIRGGTGNLVIVFRDLNGSNVPKNKANSYKECYNYHKLGRFERDWPFSDRYLNLLTNQGV